MRSASPPLVSMSTKGTVIVGNDYPFLTDESRQPIEISMDDRSIMKDLIGGKKKKFIIPPVHRFVITWDNTASTSAYTVDEALGAIDINTLVYSGGLYTLGIHFAGWNQPPFTYDCFVEDCDLSIVSRRGPLENWRYKLSLSLVEQG